MTVLDGCTNSTMARYIQLMRRIFLSILTDKSRSNVTRSTMSVAEIPRAAGLTNWHGSHLLDVNRTFTNTSSTSLNNTIMFTSIIVSEPQWSSGYTSRLSSGRPVFHSQSWLTHSSFHCIYSSCSSSSVRWGGKMSVPCIGALLRAR